MTKEKENLTKLGEELLHTDEQTLEFEFEINKKKEQFTAKLPTVRDTLQIMANARKIVSGVGLSNGEDSLLEQLALEIATLDVVLVKRPKWLSTFLDLTDWDVIHELYGKVAEWQNSFRQLSEVDTDDNQGTTV
jgi:hypothetical protein